MGQFPKINFLDTKDPRKDLRNYQIELERRLRHLLNNIDISSIILGLSSSRIVSTNASGNLESVSTLTDWILGTAGNITVTNNLDGTVTLKSIGSSVNVTTKTGTDTLTVAEQGVILCNSAGAITINLPTAVGNEGLSYFITNINSGTVTIDPNGAETLQGDSTFDLYEGENIQIVSNNVNWFVR